MALMEAQRSPRPYDGDSTLAVEWRPLRRPRPAELEGDPTLELPRARFSVTERDGDSTLPLRPGRAPLPFSAGEPRHLAMRCLYCQGKIERGTAPVSIDRGTCHLLLEAVPAWICTGCTEAYFEPREVERIRRALGAVQDLRPALR